LRVSDDGVGFPQEIDFQSTPSLGLQLVAALVGQLDGTIELHRNGGAEFLIHFSEVK
jgi:two-component sensor histidine kinase